jgi:hypothetical protein
MTKRYWPSIVAFALAAAGMVVMAAILARRDGRAAHTSYVETAMKKKALVLLAVAALGAAAVVVIAVFAPREAAAGWLLAFSYVAAFPIGSLALLMIHRLTGGRWGEAIDPLLRPLAQTLPVLLLLVLPVLFASPVLFPWAHGGVDAVTHSVQVVYLNIPAYAVRTLVALAGLCVLAYIVPGAEGRAALLWAGVGLIFYGIAVTIMGLDWLLTPEAPFFSTSFGASVAFTELLSAIALVAIASPREWKLPDLGALMLAVTLGITYTDFMAVLVMWYGDVPSKVFWIVERIHEPWLALAIAAFVVASLVPVVFLLFARVRASRAALRFIGACSLIGVAIYQSWLVAPAFGVAIIGTAALALVAMAALVAAAIAAGWTQHFSSCWRTARG